ncbi:MAG: nickel-responsive transcriptional regulator NikR [Xanthobacteraceae bacterium]
MQRITITVDDDLMTDVDRIIETRGYRNRSEAIRDLARAGLAQAIQTVGGGRDCVGALIYVYDHAARQLGNRLVHSFHEHQDVALATMHVHLDPDSCLEVAILKGRNRDVQNVADHVIAERGVRYGRLVAIPVKQESEIRRPHGGAHPHRDATMRSRRQ